MNKVDFTARVATEASLSKADADTLARGEIVRAAGFGAFWARPHPGRRHLTDGVEAGFVARGE